MMTLIHCTTDTKNHSYGWKTGLITLVIVLISNNVLAENLNVLTIDGNLAIKGNSTFSGSVSLSDKSKVLGLQVAETTGCDEGSHEGTGPIKTCTLSGSWDFCALSSFNLNAKDHNADHITCEVVQGEHNWKIKAQFDNNTNGTCKARCMNLSNKPNGLDDGEIKFE